MYITTHYKGVEKNDSKRHYFSSNKHDAPGEIIRSVNRKHCSRVYGVIPPVYAIREATTKTLPTGTRRYSGCKEAFKRRWNQFEFIRMIDHEDPPSLSLSHINQLLSKLPRLQEIPSCIPKYLTVSMHTNYMCMYVYFTTEYCII